MMDRYLRLRLHVQRNGLPDERILFPLPLANDPTIANLLELVNNDIPLEDAVNDWGLDDYVVEVQLEGSSKAFQCLHFRPVSGLLEKDDEVLIRPLMTTDIKKRRLGGRHQILSGGERIVDGVPWGRPRLRIPNGRPPVTIAPRKRRRLLESEDYDLDDATDEPNEDLAYVDYTDLQAQQDDQDQLLLTQHGEEALRPPRSVRFASNAVPHDDSEEDVANADEGGDKGEGEDEDEEDEDQDVDEDMVEPDAQELADEAADLRRELSEDGQGLSGTRTRSRSASAAAQVQQRRSDPNANAFGPFEDDEDAAQPTAARAAVPQADLPNPALSDQVITVKFAFPHAPTDICVKLLNKYNMDVSKVWTALAKTLKPRYALGETMVFATQLELPGEVQLISSPARRSPAEALEDISRLDYDDDVEDADSSGSEDEGQFDGSDVSSDGRECQATSAVNAAAQSNSHSDGESDASSEYISARPTTARTEDDDDSSDIMSSSSDSETGHGPTKQNQGLSNRTSSSSDESSSDDSSSDDSSSEESEGTDRPANHTQAPSKQSSRQSKSLSKTSIDNNDASEISEEENVAIKRKSRRARKTVDSSPVSSARSAMAKVVARPAVFESGSDKEDSTSSSDSSFYSSSDSSSESGSESEKGIAVPVLVKPPRKNPPRVKSPVKSQRATAQQKPLVAPGQGMTKTQRRNQRRRLERQSKQAALQAPTKSDHSQETTINDTDLEAKKKALLQTLGPGSTVMDELAQQAADDVEMADQDPAAWKEKIYYRAVECVQEGVELSQPPFPFVQRWDPQQRWNVQPKQHHGKRKFRADAQFYNEESLHDAKKQRYERRLDQNAYEDVELDYDDFTFNPDEDSMTNGYSGSNSKATDGQTVNDLPPLPENMASLAELHESDVKLGMVIAWKQLLCNEATQWQPLLSEYLTASVTELAEAGDEFQVQLAMRDRIIRVRKYDEETGQRVYGKFEAPDEAEDEDEELGFQYVSFSQMIEPRIVRQAAETNGVPTGTDPSEDDSSERHQPDSEAPQLPELGFEVADSQPKEGDQNQKPSKSRTKSRDQSGTPDNDQSIEPDSDTAHAMYIDATAINATVEESFIPDTVHDQAKSATVNDVSITEDRRGEIYQLINEGGFREEIRSSIDQSAFFNIGQGSPSRQLEEEYATSVLLSNRANLSRSSSEAPSEYDAKEPVKGNVSQRIVDADFQSAQLSKAQSEGRFRTPPHQDVGQLFADAEVDTFHSAPQTPSPAQMRSDRLNEDDSTRLTTPGAQHSTGRVEYPKLHFSQTTQASEISGGRQIDPNFVAHSDDLGNSHGADDTSMIDGFEDECIADLGNTTGLNQTERERTPTQRMYNDDLPKSSVLRSPLKMVPTEDERSADSPVSTASSPLLELRYISSQPAVSQFKEAPRVKAERASSRDTAAIDFQHEGSRSPPARQQSPSPVPHSTLGKTTESFKASFSSAAANPFSPPHGLKFTDSTSIKEKASNDSDAKSNSDSFQQSISPPALSRARRRRGSSVLLENVENHLAVSPSGLTDLDKRPVASRYVSSSASGTKKQAKETSFAIPAGSQVVDLLTSSPEPASKPEAGEDSDEEPELTERYADDDVDSDYRSEVPSKTKQKAFGKRKPQPRAKRGVSVPVAEEKQALTTSPNSSWVGGSQGPSRKASGRFGGRLSSTF